MPKLPHKIAVLVYIYDEDGNVLMLHRSQMPNAGFYSPIGGKLHKDEGEGPHDCAVREIQEEIGVELTHEELRLTGIVSECAYENETHWLMFLYEVNRPVRHDELAWMEFDEGKLEWIPVDEVDDLKIPQTDREVLWPLIKQHKDSGFFMVHIDCTGEDLKWKVVESTACVDSKS